MTAASSSAQAYESSSAIFLMYHELEVAGRTLCDSEAGYVRYVLPIAEFEGQMRCIRESGMRGVSVTEALTFSGPTVAITFDDGCETDLLYAAPLLKQLGFGATFYIVTGRIGKPGHMTAAQLRELHAMGFELGCHSMTHAYLSDLDEAGLRREIVDAKTALEEVLGTGVHHFSCPGGRYDSRAVAFAKKAGFRTLATSIPGTNKSSTDPYSLARIAITRGLKGDRFKKLCRGEGMQRLAIAGILRDRAKRLLGNRAYDRVRALLIKS